MENLNINIATANGTGSLSANQFLTKTLFRSGWSVGSYNFFPSNIAGLPCLYSLRLNSLGRTGFFEKADVLISLNPKNLSNDLKTLKADGLLIGDEKHEPILKQKTVKDSRRLLDNEKLGPTLKQELILKQKSILQQKGQQKGGEFTNFKGLVQTFPLDSGVRDITGLNPRHRILLKNMIYVGLLCEWLKVEEQVLEKTLKDFFQKRGGGDNSHVVRQNLEALSKGREMAAKSKFPFALPVKFLFSEKEGGEITSDPTHSDPIHSDSTHSNPVHPTVTVHPDSSQSRGKNRAGSDSDPIHSDSTHSNPVHPTVTVHPDSSQSRGKNRAGSDSDPIHPDSTHSDPVHPTAQTNPTPSDSAQTDPTPSDSSNHPNSIHPKNHSKKRRGELNAKKEILIEGNSGSALGALFSGCQFLSWYPITPASSLAENFESLANRFQIDSEGKKKFAVLQAEDELAGISQAIGAAWGGLRAMTVTSGPGLSLMSEGAGLAHFAEIPLVLCNVQRAGPSTGLPTRTLQGDLLSSCFLSHGDSRLVNLFPGTPEEAFHLTAQAFDLAEQLSSIVLVLSDLDLGMNLRMSRIFNPQDLPLKRGKLLREADLEKMDRLGQEFLPYGDEAMDRTEDETRDKTMDQTGDGISFRTLPGVRHPKGAYLTRGSGHNKRAEYSERPEDFSYLLEKLNRKWETAKKLVPQPIVESCSDKKTAFVTFGPNEPACRELISLMEPEGLRVNFMRVRSFPFPQAVDDFLKSQREVFVIEQNSTGQLKQLLSGEFPTQAYKMKSLLQYDGRPLIAESLKRKLCFSTKKRIG